MIFNSRVESVFMLHMTNISGQSTISYERVTILYDYIVVPT